MTLSERVHMPPPRTNGRRPCSIAEVYRALKEQPEELAALELLLYGPSGWGKPAFHVTDVLKAEGYTVSPQQVNRHRGKRCGCFRPQAGE